MRVVFFRETKARGRTYSLQDSGLFWVWQDVLSFQHAKTVASRLRHWFCCKAPVGQGSAELPAGSPCPETAPSLPSPGPSLPGGDAGLEPMAWQEQGFPLGPGVVFAAAVCVSHLRGVSLREGSSPVGFPQLGWRRVGVSPLTQGLLGRKTTVLEHWQLAVRVRSWGQAAGWPCSSGVQAAAP